MVRNRPRKPGRGDARGFDSFTLRHAAVSGEASHRPVKPTLSGHARFESWTPHHSEGSRITVRRSGPLNRALKGVVGSTRTHSAISLTLRARPAGFDWKLYVGTMIALAFGYSLGNWLTIRSRRKAIIHINEGEAPPGPGREFLIERVIPSTRGVVAVGIDKDENRIVGRGATIKEAIENAVVQAMVQDLKEKHPGEDFDIEVKREGEDENEKEGEG